MIIAISTMSLSRLVNKFFKPTNGLLQSDDCQVPLALHSKGDSGYAFFQVLNWWIRRDWVFRSRTIVE